MKQPERREEHAPACGYGLLGLCCSSCLLGPCRLTPFDGDSARALCGDDREILVARNLLRIAFRECSQSIRDLKEAILKISSLGPNSTLVEESKDLLSFFPEGLSSPILSLYSAKVFPAVQQIFHGTDFPPKSIISLVLDLVDVGEKQSSEVEEILTQSLRISLLALISDGLQKDLNHVIDGGKWAPGKEKISEAQGSLPSTPCPVIIYLSDDDLPFAQSLNKMRDELRQRLDGNLPVISIKEVHALPEIGRRLFKRWALSVSDVRSLVLISSRRVTSVLGPLSLGYTVVSFPPLPIHGSARVEKFFCEDFEKMSGNRYLPSWEENTTVKIAERLMGLK